MFILLLFNSCKKDSKSTLINSQPNLNSDFLIEAKTYFKENYQEVQPKQNLSNTHQADDLFKKLGKKVLWQYAKKTKISLGEAIRVPIYYNKQTFTRVGKNKSAIDLYNLSYLMMYKDKNNQMHTEWVITMPDDDFVDKKPLSNPRFSGLIYILDWKGSLIKAYKITPDGHQYISNDISFSEGDKQLMVSDTRKTDYVYEECTQTGYFQDCNNGCSGGKEYVLVSSCYWVSIDDGGGGGSSGGITPSDPSTGGGGGSATSPVDYTPENPNCPSSPIGNSTGNIKVDMVSPDDPCGNNNPDLDILNSILEPVKPCALKFGAVNSNWQAVGIDKYKIGIHSNIFGDKFIEFSLEIGIPYYLQNGKQITTSEAQNITAIALSLAEKEIVDVHGVDFFLSSGAQPKYSNMFAQITQEIINASIGSTFAATVKLV